MTLLPGIVSNIQSRYEDGNIQSGPGKAIVLVKAKKGASLMDALQQGGPIQELQGVDWVKMTDRPLVMANGEEGSPFWIVGIDLLITELTQDPKVKLL